MKLHKLENRKTGGYATFGSVWEQGEIPKAGFSLTNEKGEPVPVQSRVTAWWPDGSIKWAAHTADSSLLGEEAEILPLSEQVSDAAKETGIRIVSEGQGYWIDTGVLELNVPGAGASVLAEHVKCRGEELAASIYPVLILERRSRNGNRSQTEEIPFTGVVKEVDIEEEGPLQCVIRFSGIHREEEGTEAMPFIIRMYLFHGKEEIRFVHTFFYDGKEDRDYLKAMGIRFEAALKGSSFNRHIQFGTDLDGFHEAAVMMVSSHPRTPQEMEEKQMAGEFLQFEEGSEWNRLPDDLPLWEHFSICQDSPSHFAIQKQTESCCCSLDCMHGYRAPGTMAVTGERGGLLFAVKDFWQKYPSGLEAEGLAQERTLCTVWFYSPEAKAMDFRHYSTKSYQMTCYEGFPEVGASAYGIGVTSECSVRLTDEVPSDEEMEAFGARIQKPAVYVGTPEYYHEKRALGYWSLKKEDSETEQWLECQLEQAVSYYMEQVEQRSWYGLFNYGDFMHTYDPVRHCWKYDVGGFAWQNTELVPTLWLWLYFLRTGREDVFTLAEAMSRHCSEVDVYHFGPYKGIGSRHNVRHWGCSCKEPRIAMAGHHRAYYYLTGDQRIGEMMEETKDADHSLEHIKYFVTGTDETTGKPVVQARSGPDWSSFVANWVTKYERTLDETYRQKIETGMDDFKKAPLELISGPEFQYDPETAHLIYKGEGLDNTHLSICMGGPQIWFETADMLKRDDFKKMLADFGRLYFLSQEEKNQRTGGLIGERRFSLPFFASTMAAYGAVWYRDEALAKQTWEILLKALVSESDMTGFQEQTYAVTKEGTPLKEIPWLKTNFASQWCLNVIMVLDFIRDAMPKTMEELKQVISGEEFGLHQA